MKNFHVEPVERTQAPRYPDKNEPVAVGRAVEAWFSPVTLAIAGLSGLAACACRPVGAADEESKIDVNQKQVAETVEKYLKWFPAPEGRRIKLEPVPSGVDANPPVNRAVEEMEEDEPQGVLVEGDVAFYVPRPPLDVEKAKAATMELFKLYGISLKENVQVALGEAEFEADGYSSEKKIGFEIVFAREEEYLRKEIADTEKELVPSEMVLLDEQVKSGQACMLVVKDTLLGSEDVSVHAVMKAYLQSVVDYLEWLRKNGRI